jgi:hypothetical protein
MSRLAWIVVLATLPAAPAAAQQGAIPDLRGTWKGTSESIILGAGNPHHAAPAQAEPRLNSVEFTMTVDKSGRPPVLRHVFLAARQRQVRRRDLAQQHDFRGRRRWL